MKKQEIILIKPCAICTRDIQMQKEDYANIRDFSKGKFTTECFMHTSCWNEKFAVIKQLEMANLQGTFNTFNKLIKQIAPNGL